MRRILLLIALLLAVACSQSPTIPPATATPTVTATPEGRAWTVMIYMDSDNDLEANQLDDFREMAQVGSSPRVQLVAYMDRCQDGESEQDGCSDEDLLNLPNWHGAKLLAIDKGKFEELDDWGVVNSASPKTLERFVSEARKRYPARRYALIIGDHGDGWTGACLDDSAGGEEILTPAEMAKALDGANLELLGFDCCLMGTLEVGLALSHDARYLVSSEELEPLSGWDYKAVLTALNKNPEMDGAQLGTIIADTYQSSFASDDSEGLAITLSVVDLSKLPAVQKALEKVGAALAQMIESGGRKAWVGAARARAHAEEYGSSDDLEPGSSMHDIVDLAGNLAMKVPSLTADALALQEAARAAVVHTVHGKARPQANGLSLFFPPTAEEIDPAYGKTPGVPKAWLTFLNSYSDFAGTDLNPPKITKLKASPDSFKLGDSITVTAQVADADDLDTCSFVLVQNYEDGKVIIGSLPMDVPENGKLKREWDGRWYALGDKEGFLTISVTEVQKDADGGYLVTCPAQWQKKKKSRWKDVTLHLYLEPEKDGEMSGQLVYAMLDEENEPAREVELEPGNRLRAVFLELDEQGDPVYVPDENEEDVLLVDKDGIQVEMLDVDPGSWSVGFELQDLSGNTAHEYTDVEIDE